MSDTPIIEMVKDTLKSLGVPYIIEVHPKTTSIVVDKSKQVLNRIELVFDDEGRIFLGFC